MPVRKIVQIDEEKCNGCGLCVPDCAEGALQIVDGKARLVKESYCDGLGACLGACPQDAIRIVERDVDGFDEEAVQEHLADAEPESPGTHAEPHAGCPGMALMDFADGAVEGEASPPRPAAEQPRPSALRQWPVQLHLVPPTAPWLDGADLLLAADCVPFAYAGFHRDMLDGKRLLVGCPKLDDAGAYVEKLTQILRHNDIRSLTVVHMEVPCCSGLVMLAQRAVQQSGSDVPFEDITVSLKGHLKDSSQGERLTTLERS